MRKSLIILEISSSSTEVSVMEEAAGLCNDNYLNGYYSPPSMQQALPRRRNPPPHHSGQE
ncbi:hypothetical protein J6590_042507 [Homalodisca vitripennis]|nr:hypothetical protein J6590_042507 [Homalodisca vitripennis]